MTGRGRGLAAALLPAAVIALPAAAGAPPAACGDEPPPEVADADGDWPLANLDYGNTRTQPVTRLDTTTVADLELVWEYPVPGDALFGNLTTTPLVIDDTMYLGALDGSMHAVDVDDGTARWSIPRDVSVFGPAGAAVGWGKVFGIAAPAVVVANDAVTGAEVWTQDLGVAAGNQVDMQPTVIGDCVLVATQGLAPGSRGTLYTLDQATGQIVWSVETVPDDFWGNPDVNHGGGSWYPPTVDTTRGRVWWGTSNPWPSPGNTGFPAGSSRPGDNLLTDSALSLHLADGTLDWYRQAFAHDIFDRDMVLTQLVDLPGGGDVLVHTGKGGVVFGLDPDTGALLWQTPVGTHLNDHLTDFVGPLTVMPGVLGGVETPPAAADGVVYLAVMNAPTTYAGPEQTFSLSVDLGARAGELVAIDAGTGAVLWASPVDGNPLGGATVAGDLVLTSTFEGELLGFDRLTGERVWSYTAPGFVNGWPAVTDDMVLFPVSGGEVSAVLAFRLPPSPPDDPAPVVGRTGGDGRGEAPRPSRAANQPAPAAPARAETARPAFTG